MMMALKLKRAQDLKYFLAAPCITVCLSAFALLATKPHAFAGDVDVVKVRAKQASSGLWRFSVSLRHDDKGWNHYADNWEVLSPSGEVIATRVLGHPHVDEQPFTRSLSVVDIPDGLTEVIIRGRDSVHGYGGQMMRVDLNTRKTEIVKVETEDMPLDTGATDETPQN